MPQSILASTADGQLASNLNSIEILANPDSPQQADVVETFLPLLDATDDTVVGVIGITRDVTATLTSQIAETRSSISNFTMLSLGSVFLILLVFIFIADAKIFRANWKKFATNVNSTTDC